MSKPENPQAFPSVFGPDGGHSGGLTMRDYFAAKAMAAIAASSWYDGRMDIEGVAYLSPSIAMDAYAMADAMLKARMKP